MALGNKNLQRHVHHQKRVIFEQENFIFLFLYTRNIYQLFFKLLYTEIMIFMIDKLLRAFQIEIWVLG